MTRHTRDVIPDLDIGGGTPKSADLEEERRVAAFDAVILRELCDCDRCHLCGFISPDPPPSKAIAIGGKLYHVNPSTPEGE